MRWRVLMAIFGALPATALGVGAFMGVVAGGQRLTANRIEFAILFTWGALGFAGVVGLWLAALNRDPRLAVPLTVCGLIAAVPLIAWAGFAAVAGGSPWLVLPALSPFVCGLAYVVVAARRWRRRRSPDP